LLTSPNGNAAWSCSASGDRPNLAIWVSRSDLRWFLDALLCIICSVS
jgi:hypothetical protein